MWLGLFSIPEDPATWYHRDRMKLKFSPRSASWVETYFVFLYLWALPRDWASSQGQSSESCPRKSTYKDKQPKDNRLSYWPNASWLCRHLKPGKFYMCEEDFQWARIFSFSTRITSYHCTQKRKYGSFKLFPVGRLLFTDKWKLKCKLFFLTVSIEDTKMAVTKCHLWSLKSQLWHEATTVMIVSSQDVTFRCTV